MITQEQDLSFKEKLTKLSKSYFFLIYSLIGSTTTVLIIFQIISFPILFLDNLQLKPVHFGLLALMLGLVSVTSTSICLRFAKNHQELLRKLSIFSTLCFSLWLFIWNYYDLHLVSLILPVAMLSLSLEIFTPLITAKIYACHQENVKLASSFYNSLQMFACIIGSVLASLIETHLFRNVFMCSMALTFFITISYLITSKREQNLLQGRS